MDLVKSNCSISSAAFLCYTMELGGVLLSLQSVTLKHLVGNRWSATLVKNVLPSPEDSGLTPLIFFFAVLYPDYKQQKLHLEHLIQ